MRKVVLDFLASKEIPTKSKSTRFSRWSSRYSSFSVEEVNSSNEECSRSETYAESQSEKKHVSYVLPPTHITEAILEETIDMIQLVNKRDYATQHVHLNKWKYKTPWERFGKAKHFTLEVEIQGANEDMTKILSGGARLCKALEVIKDELVYSGTFEKLTTMINDFKNTKEDNLLLINSNEKDRYDVIRHEIDMIDKRVKKLKRDNFILVDKLETDSMEAARNNEMQRMYTENWEAFCVDQLKTVNHMTSHAIAKEIRQTMVKMHEEKYVHSKIEKYMWESTDDLKKEIDYWVKRYSDDYQEKSTEILRTQEKREELKVLMTDLQKTYQRRNEEIKEYLALKEKRQEEEELRRQQEELEKQQKDELERLKEEQKQKEALNAEFLAQNTQKNKNMSKYHRSTA